MQTDDTTLGWAEARPYYERVRSSALRHLCSIFAARNGGRDDGSHSMDVHWGDELEYHVLRVEPARRAVAPSLRNVELVAALRAGAPDGANEWQLEAPKWLVESSPARPYGPALNGMLDVEASMRARRSRLEAALQADERAVTFAGNPLPLVGTHQPCADDGVRGPPSDASAAAAAAATDATLLLPGRARALAANLRDGRASPIVLPLFRDVATADEPCVQVRAHTLAHAASCCALQVTLGASDAAEACKLHDAALVLAPLLLALTAASPALFGRLVDTDTRWPVWVGSMVERSAGSARSADRWGTLAGGYADEGSPARASGAEAEDEDDQDEDDIIADGARAFHDEALGRLRAAGCPPALGAKLALTCSAFEPLVMARADARTLADGWPADADADRRHWVSVLYSSFPCVRLKPPSQADTDPGWRVELRTMEAQLTDGANAACAVCATLFVQALVRSGLDVRVPLSDIRRNMARAHARDAVLHERFAFSCGGHTPVDLTLDEIVNGAPALRWEGLVPLARRHVSAHTDAADEATRCAHGRAPRAPVRCAVRAGIRRRCAHPPPIPTSPASLTAQAWDRRPPRAAFRACARLAGHARGARALLPARTRRIQG